MVKEGGQLQRLTHFDSGSHPANPWQIPLEQQSVDFAIPERFTPRTIFTRKDELTGLTLETDRNRRKAAKRLSRAIRTDEPWMSVLADLNNLKKVNDDPIDGDRLLGNLYIRYGAAKITQIVDDLNLPSEVEITALRKGFAADETQLFIFGATVEQQQHIIDSIQTTDTLVPIPNTALNFSIATSIVTSNDPRIQGDLLSTKEWLSKGRTRIALNFYQDIYNLLDHDAKVKKIEQDTQRMPRETLASASGQEEVVDIFRRNIGGGRVSEELLEGVLKVTSVEAARNFVNRIHDPELAKAVLIDLGIPSELFNQAKTPDELIAFFNQVFGA